MELLTALKNSSKGKMCYDPKWANDPKTIETMLEECTSPPSLHPFTSPTISTSTTQEDISPSTLSSLSSSQRTLSSSQSIIRENNDMSSKLSFSNLDLQVDEVICKYETGSVFCALQECEDEMRRQVQAALTQKYEEYKSSYDMFHAELQLKEDEMNMMLEIRARQKREEFQKLTQSRKQETEERQQQLKENHKRHARVLSAKLRDAEQQKLKFEQECNRLSQEKLVKIQDFFAKFQSVAKTMQSLHASCEFRQFLPKDLDKHIGFVSDIEGEFKRLMQCAKQATNVEDQHVNKASQFYSNSLAVEAYIQKAVDVAREKGQTQMVQQQKQHEELERQERQRELERQKEQEQQLHVSKEQISQKDIVSEDSGEILCVSPESFKKYTTLMEIVKQVENIYADLIQDPSMKKYKFDLQKAVNTPVNAISPTSGSHLRDKLTRLYKLITGQTVDIVNKQICAKDHPGGTPFCKDLLAKKIVNQGEEQVSSNHDSAFAIAAVTVGIWCEVPAFGDLLMARFYQKCPYVLPYYPPKEEGQSSEEYYRSLGYNYTGSECEKQDKYLKRMSGIIRLYASLMVSAPPRGPQHPHPQGLNHGWVWLANILNMEPRPDITATLLYDFLSVTANHLERTYGKQFHKLLYLLATEYMPKILSVTPKGCGGPVTRLESFLGKCMQSIHNIPKPYGMLSPNFWFT